MSSPKRRSRRSFGQIKTSAAGRRYASYIGPDRRRHHAPYSFSTVTDADGWLASQRVSIEAGVWTTDTPLDASVVEAKKAAAERSLRDDEPTFAAYAQVWVRNRRKRGQPLAAKTQTEYFGYVTRELTEFTDMRMSAITEEDVAEWFERMRRTGKAAALEKSYSMMSSVFKTAVQDKQLPLVTANPCTVPGGKTVYAARRKHEHAVKIRSSLVTADEVNLMAGAVEDWFRAAVLLGAWLGVRSGELRELRRKDVLIDSTGDEVTVIVHVERGVTWVSKEDRKEIETNLRSGQWFDDDGYLVGPTKSEAGVRMILVPPHIVPDLLQHLDTHVHRDPEALLFSSRTDARRHLATASFSKYWNPARLVAGRPGVRFHDLRHHAATEYALSGATLRELMERLGHSSVDVAMIYQHTAEQRDKELTLKMSERAQAAINPKSRPTHDQEAWMAAQFAELRALLTQQKESN